MLGEHTAGEERMGTRKSMEQRREEFVEAAAHVIAREGFERATTRRIAEAAEAPLASLHYCFRGKDELLQAVQAYLSEELSTRLPPLPPETRGLEAAVAAHAERVWGRIRAHPEEQVATFEMLLRRYRREQPEDQIAENAQMYEAWIESTSGIYARAAEAAGEPVPSNLREVTQLFIAGIDGLSMLHIASPESVASDEILATLVRATIRACTYEPAAAPA